MRDQTTFKLKKPVEYAKGGESAIAETIIMYEPVSSSAVDTLVLSQAIRSASISAIKNFFGDDLDADAGQQSGEEIVPFHMQDEPDVDKVNEEATGVCEMIMSGNGDLRKIYNIGKKLLTTRYESAGRRRLCMVDDDQHMTTVIFDRMDLTDQIRAIAWYYTFFGLSSIGR